LDDVNRATSETQIDQQFRVGTLPHVRHWEAIINSVTQEDYGLPVAAHFDLGREAADRLMEAQAHQLWVSMGAESSDEPRDEILGLPVDNQNPVPRGYYSAKGAFTPIKQLQALAGPVDHETYSPVEAPTEALWPQMVAGFGSASPQIGQLGPQDIHDQRGSDHAGAPVDPEDAEYQSSATETADKPAGYGTAGLERNARRGKKSTDLANWQRQSRERVRKGKSPRQFADSAIDQKTHEAIWDRLCKATSLEDVEAAFRNGMADAQIERLGLRGPEELATATLNIIEKAGQSDPKDHRRPGPFGHLEPLLTAYWQAPVLAALMAEIPALEITQGWLKEWAKTPGLPVTSDAAMDVARAYTAAMRINHEPLRKVLTNLYSDSWLPGVRDAVEHIRQTLPGALKPRLRIVSQAMKVDWDQWTPGHPPDQKILYDIFFDPQEADKWLKAIDSTTCRNIAQVLHDGVEQGLGSDEIARRIDQYLNDPKRARMIAVTECNRAMSRAAYETYKAHGLNQWNLLTALDPCPICQAIKDSNPHTMQETMMMPPEHPNCLPGWIRVVPGDVEAGLPLDPSANRAVGYVGAETASAVAVAERNEGGRRLRAATERDFVGELVVVKTALGHELAATPNHPVATAGGWLPVSALREGDRVLSSTRPEWVVDAVNPDVENIPPTIQEVAESLPVAFGPMPSSPEDFHGDGANSEVYVVRADGLLGFAYAALCQEHRLEKALGGGDVELEPLHDERVGDLALHGVGSASHGGMSTLGEPLTLFEASLGHTDNHPGAAVTGGDSMSQQDAADSSAADSEGFCKRLLALSAEIASDEVVSVKRVPFRGHVYNLETSGGWYIGNGIVTHNCRCNLLPVLPTRA
jgi:hypothetical protein